MNASDELERDRAAYIIADLLANVLLQAADEKPPRTFRYIWENRAIRWLQERIEGEGGVPCMNAWTAHYIGKLPGRVVVEYNDEAAAREQGEVSL